MCVSFEKDSINWAKGGGLSKKSHFPNRTSKPGTRRHTFNGCHTANFALGQQDETKKNIRCICLEQKVNSIAKIWSEFLSILVSLRRWSHPKKMVRRDSHSLCSYKWRKRKTKKLITASSQQGKLALDGTLKLLAQ